ncbi:hypothetical protein BD408DRAFT_424459 [Parasitella parasitica]|nr:hypothetical protein BD408DRAFT_424459 [Parasitella parasitica]
MNYYNNNRKREHHHYQQHQQQQQPTPKLYMDIFEPPPQWVPSVSNSNINNANSQSGFHAHSPTHRSPIQHHPSLSEIVFQEYNSPSDRQEGPGVFQQNRRSYPFALQQQRVQQQLQKKRLQEHLQFKKQQQQIQEQDGHHHTKANSIGSAHDFESAASSPYTVSTSPKYLQYDDIDEDIESINRSMFRNQHNHRHQADNISIATSLFTAVEHLGNDSEEEDSSSTENQRHGFVTTTVTNQESQDSVNEVMKKLDIQTSIQWDDYKPQYRLLNESYDSVKQDIYKEIFGTMQKMQELDYKFNTAKATFHSSMEENYEQMSSQLISQCYTLKKEKLEFETKTKTDESTQHCLPKSGKIRLNVGGGIFETSLSTLRRDTNCLLATMFSGRHLISAEPDGSYFIDRDPLHFRLVLNYLRDLRIPPTILEDTKICHELLQEAKYYCIEGLVKLLQQH